MTGTAFAIATDNELEALDLEQIVVDALNALSYRIKMPAQPGGAPDKPMPIPVPHALFLGHSENDPRHARLVAWARETGVRVIRINGRPSPDENDLFLARPFTQDDVERVIYGL